MVLALDNPQTIKQRNQMGANDVLMIDKLNMNSYEIVDRGLV